MTEMQNLYNAFLAGAESIFKHSFDMKVKETIAKVQEDHKQDKITKEEEENRRSKQQKRAQRIARNAALAALATKDASKNITLSTYHTPNISLDHMEQAREGMIVSSKGLKEDCCLGQRSSNKGEFVNEHQLDQHTQGINFETIDANDSFVCLQEMTVQEKVDQWQKNVCFELPKDHLHDEDFVRQKGFGKETMFEDILCITNHKASEKTTNKDGGVLLMLEQNEVRLLKKEVSAQQLEEDMQILLQRILETKNDIIEDGKNQSKEFVDKSSPWHIQSRLWKEVYQSNMAVRGYQLPTQCQNKPQGKKSLSIYNIFSIKYKIVQIKFEKLYNTYIMITILYQLYVTKISNNILFH